MFHKYKFILFYTFTVLARCCPDSVSYAHEVNFSGCCGCENTPHKCCPDRHTEATGPNFEGCSCHTYQFGCCPDGETIAEGPNNQGCLCRDTPHGCCSDGVTAATGPDQDGCDCGSSQFGCCPDGVTKSQSRNFTGCADAPINRQAACALPYEGGPCNIYSLQWYYDMQYGGCLRFHYGGCEGNGNNFIDKAECEDVCVRPDAKDACNLPKVKGSCSNSLNHWYYDINDRACVPFNYGGCLGNANNFESRELCEKQCAPKINQGLQYDDGIPMPDKTSYARELDGGLFLYVEPAAFWDAHDTCLREGGVLASPTTDALLQAMRTAMTDYELKSSNVFVGIASQAKGDRSLSTFSNASLQWAADEPSNAADEQCLALTGAGALVDVSCDRAHPYFCRKELAHKSHICERPLSNGYEYEPRTGSCYKFHRIALAFRPAQAACHAEGGTLAVINSVTEADVLQEIFDKNPPQTLTGTVDPSHAAVGFRKYEDDVWVTIHGDTLAEAGFSVWEDGEPNNATDDDELCGSITKKGLLNNISCKGLMAFICEINPKD